MSISNHSDPSTLKVSLKRSKTDKLGKETNVYMGTVAGHLCPVSAAVVYMVTRGNSDGPFLNFRMVSHLQNLTHVKLLSQQSTFHVINLQIKGSVLEQQQQLPGQKLRILKYAS